MKKINSILIANRSEIARRIARTCKKLGIKTVAIYSTADQDSDFIKDTDDAVWIGESESNDSYLNIEAIISAAKSLNVDAIHPGYGFLSENPLFAKACNDAGIIFIGPTSETISTVADKREAKAIAQSLKIPTSSSIELSSFDEKKINNFITDNGLPALIKAAFGGGGRGMRIIRSEKDISSLCQSAADEAKKFFSSGEIFVEQFIENARHVEVQIVGSNDGDIIALGTRDCSLQRNYQKVIEEAPAGNLSAHIEQSLIKDAIAIGKAVNYQSVGTVEFLVKGENYYFLEVNSRIQVEHPVTEMIYQVDLIEAQIKVAQGLPINEIFPSLPQPSGFAIEARICAENPRDNFSSQIGYINKIDFPAVSSASGLGNVRYDFAYDDHGEVSHFYDSMIGKVISWSSTREHAIEQLISALTNLRISGVLTNTEHLLSLLRNDNFKSLDIHTQFIKEQKTNTDLEFFDHLLIAATHFFDLWSNSSPAIKNYQESSFRLVKENIQNLDGKISGINKSCQATFVRVGNQSGIQSADIVIDKKNISLKKINPYSISASIPNSLNPDFKNLNLAFSRNGSKFFIFSELGAITCELPAAQVVSKFAGNSFDIEVNSPLPGKIINVLVSTNQTVKAGDSLLTIESMKMEHQVRSPRDGVIEQIHVKANQSVNKDSALIRFEKA